MLRGDTRDFFFGAYLGSASNCCCTLWHLVVKSAQLLAPQQHGLWCQGWFRSCCTYAACCYLNNIEQDQEMVKLDFANAFNSIRRDCMFGSCVQQSTPLSTQCKLHLESNLQWNDIILSSDGRSFQPFAFLLDTA